MDYIVNGISSTTRLVICPLSLSLIFFFSIPIYVINNNYTHKRAHRTSWIVLAGFFYFFFRPFGWRARAGSPKGHRRTVCPALILCISIRISFYHLVYICTGHTLRRRHCNNKMYIIFIYYIVIILHCSRFLYLPTRKCRYYTHAREK